MDTLPSGNRKWWLQVRLGCVRLSPSCPFRLLHTFLSPGPRGITPAFGYGAPHPSARGTSTLPINALLSAHYGPLRLPARAAPAVMSSLGPSGSGCPPHPAGSPRFLDCSFPARCPQPPRKARLVLSLVASQPMTGFINSGRLAAFACVTRPNRVRLCYGSQVCLPGFHRTDYSIPLRFSYMLNEQFTW
jgi:hypothetical protein